jgi:peroxiredoxin
MIQQQRRHLLRVMAWASAIPASIGNSVAMAAASVGQAAPSFESPDLSGRVVRLSDFKGKSVVLEWFNPQCPFVRKHYDSKNMQALQARATSQGLVWLAVVSTHPGHPDYQSAAQLQQTVQQWGAKPSATLMDPDGHLGKLYGARTTPHLFIIDPTGRMIYNGAIDDIRSANVDDVKIARNFVSAAPDDIKAGRPITTAQTQPYGCSVKYK